MTNTFSVTATLDPGASVRPVEELVALEKRLVNLGAVDPTATMDERTQTVNVRFGVAAEPHQIRGIIDTILLELAQLAAWTVSGIAYYAA